MWARCLAPMLTGQKQTGLESEIRCETKPCSPLRADLLGILLDNSREIPRLNNCFIARCASATLARHKGLLLQEGISLKNAQNPGAGKMAIMSTRQNAHSSAETAGAVAKQPPVRRVLVFV